MPAESAYAALFPGQGSHTSGMGEMVRESDPELHARCCELVGADPFPLVEDSTRFAQPAIFCASVAAWAAGRPAAEPAAYAGHSLGEFAALAAAGSLEVMDALELVVVRGRLMAGAESGLPGGMIALLGAEPGVAQKFAAAHNLSIANDNAPGQLVLSGPAEGVESAAAAAREVGLRAMRLGVTAAFHSEVMAPAAAEFAEQLADASFHAPSAPVWSAMTAAPFTDPARELADALTHPVRWRELLVRMHDEHIGRFLDCGPGRVLARLVKRTLDEAEALEIKEVAGAPA
ncbi:MAG: hypothetical protein QOG62_1255 [Thermoleophilaceae bacterium]|jgi:malonyl CoA-acyl carrier protein transacylase|nr:hypothetical protein [Thermoleophilaceae bacterium]